jgi:hypothetical protein
VGSLTVKTNPFAHIVLDNGKDSADADASGNHNFEGLAPGPHTVDVKLDNFVPQSGKTIDVKENEWASLDATMERVPPTGNLKADRTTIDYGDSVNLTWQVNNASSVTLDGSAVQPSDSKSVTPDHTWTYQLLANNGAYLIGSVTINVRPKIVESAPPSPPPPPPPAPIDPKVALRAAIKSFYLAFNSHDVSKIKAAWPDMNAGQAKAYEKLFADKDNRKMTATGDCSSASLTFTGDNAADWTCMETTILDPSAKTENKKPQPIHFRFAKKDGAWVIIDRH